MGQDADGSPELTLEDDYLDGWEDAVMAEVLQYAYENDLTTDYRLSSFSIAHLFGPLVQTTIPPTGADGFTDQSHLAEVDIQDSSPRERPPTTTQGALRLIDEARRPLTDEEVGGLTQEICGASTLSQLKLELPILRTDNKLDLKEFERQNLARLTSLPDSIKNHKLPLDPPNVDKGEGMELSVKARAECESLMGKLEREKLEINRDSLRYLASQLKHEFTEEDQMTFLIECIKYEKNPAMEKLTPPASPKLRPHNLMPEFEPVFLPIPSDDSSSMLSENFHAIEKAMLGEHQDVWSENTSPLRELLEDFTTPDQEALACYPRQNLEDFKIEVPLMFDEAPQFLGPSRPNAFKDFVDAEMDLDPEFEKAVLHGFSDDDLENQLKEIEDNTIKSIEQEQLVAVDAVARVPIPVMDFSIPEPEWTRLRNDAKAIFKWIRARNEQLFKAPSWPVYRASESKLVWNPLSLGASPAIGIENMDDGRPLVQMLLKPPGKNEILTSLDFVQQRNRPVVFEDQDGDEEIELQLTSRRNPGNDLLDTVKKRTMDSEAFEGFVPAKKPRLAEKPPPAPKSEYANRTLLAGDSPGASAKLLANFMEVNAPKKKPLTHSKYFASQKSATPTPSMPMSIPKDTHPSGAFTKAMDVLGAQRPARTQEAPCPPINPPGFPLTVFISIKIPHRMIRGLERLLPELTLFERDHDAHNTSVWRQGSVARTESIPDLANDADITLSPTTGLIITSMIRIRQKPRAGTNRSMVQTRVEKASIRYERLIVLIGGEGGGNDTINDIASSESAALIELQGFVSGLDCHIQVHYVGGGDKTLANWVAYYICRYSLTERKILTGLLQAETLWEVFLRRAGFNVFAAQVLVSQLKMPEPDAGAPSIVQYGLGAFMTMTRAERMRRFGQLVGPRVLGRVSKAVDELWNQGRGKVIGRDF